MRLHYNSQEANLTEAEHMRVRGTITSIVAGLLLSACTAHPQSSSVPDLEPQTQYILPTIGIVKSQQPDGPRINLCVEKETSTYEAFFANKSSERIDVLRVTDRPILDSQTVEGVDKAGYFDFNNKGISGLQQGVLANVALEQREVPISRKAASHGGFDTASKNATELFCQLSVSGDVVVSDTDPAAFEPTGRQELARQLAVGTLVDLHYKGPTASFNYGGGIYLETANAQPQIDGLISLLPPQDADTP